ncbi:hypothetical protein QFC20_003785 [Naganishia adeliensis]|uniref:Uncharacterized protein n=1 Tax=Naganishia adeliensis TaxID=92952 RepID=A0ACC2W6Z6_9TREE|nr:hypothetical protein QFC20_003785 [Naganishia adeliensis]
MVSDRVRTVQSKLSFAAPVRQGTKSNPVVIDVEDSDEGEQEAIDLESEESEGPDYLEGTTEAESSDEDQQDGMDPAEPERRGIARHVELLYKGELKKKKKVETSVPVVNTLTGLLATARPEQRQNRESVEDEDDADDEDDEITEEDQELASVLSVSGHRLRARPAAGPSASSATSSTAATGKRKQSSTRKQQMEDYTTLLQDAIVIIEKRSIKKAYRKGDSRIVDDLKGYMNLLKMNVREGAHAPMQQASLTAVTRRVEEGLQNPAQQLRGCVGSDVTEEIQVPLIHRARVLRQTARHAIRFWELPRKELLSQRGRKSILKRFPIIELLLERYLADKPSGQIWPGKISEELAAYLETPAGFRRRAIGWKEDLATRRMIEVPPRLKSGEKEILIIFHNETAVHAQEMPRSVWVYQSVYGAPAKVRGQAYDDLGLYHRD